MESVNDSDPIEDMITFRQWSLKCTFGIDKEVLISLLTILLCNSRNVNWYRYYNTLSTNTHWNRDFDLLQYSLV